MTPYKSSSRWFLSGNCLHAPASCNSAHSAKERLRHRGLEAKALRSRGAAQAFHGQLMQDLPLGFAGRHFGQPNLEVLKGIFFLGGEESFQEPGLWEVLLSIHLKLVPLSL